MIIERDGERTGRIRARTRCECRLRPRAARAQSRAAAPTGDSRERARRTSPPWPARPPSAAPCRGRRPATTACIQPPQRVRPRTVTRVRTRASGEREGSVVAGVYLERLGYVRGPERGAEVEHRLGRHLELLGPQRLHVEREANRVHVRVVVRLDAESRVRVAHHAGPEEADHLHARASRPSKRERARSQRQRRVDAAVDGIRKARRPSAELAQLERKQRCMHQQLLVLVCAKEELVLARLPWVRRRIRIRMRACLSERAPHAHSRARFASQSARSCVRRGYGTRPHRWRERVGKRERERGPCLLSRRLRLSHRQEQYVAVLLLRHAAPTRQRVSTCECAATALKQTLRETRPRVERAHFARGGVLRQT
eukprot:6177180-Pleurochrysis_carterae.AAC.2